MNIVNMKDGDFVIGYGVFSLDHDDVIATFETEAECAAFIVGFEFSNSDLEVE